MRISEVAAAMGGSQVFLEEGEEITVEELFKSTIIASANDSAAALALLKAVRPAIAEIKDDAQRKAVSDAVLGLVSGKSDAAKLVKAKPAAQASASIEDVQKMYDRLNPHKKEVN